MPQSYKNQRTNENDLDVRNIQSHSIYLNFKKTLQPLILDKSFAIGVSGGPDSLALAALAKQYSNEFNNPFIAIIIDHAIRKNSAKEAKITLQRLNEKNIDAVIVRYKGEKFSSNIQKHARDLRFELIQNYCKKNNIQHLILGHHRDDLLENFYIRLIRGSGLKGLSSFNTISHYSKKFLVLRPLLHYSKEDLTEITKKVFRNYIKDPSNDNDKFLRVRIRKLRQQFKNEGLSETRLMKTIENLSIANDSLNFYLEKAEKKYLRYQDEGYVILNKNLFKNEAKEIIFQLISKSITFVSGNYYPPRSDSIKSAIEHLTLKKQNTITLGGCIVEHRGNVFYIAREDRNIPVLQLNKKDILKNWDKRFLVTNRSKTNIILKRLGENGINFLKSGKKNIPESSMPEKVKKTLPSFWSKKGELMFVPFINYKNSKYAIKSDTFSVCHIGLV